MFFSRVCFRIWKKIKRLLLTLADVRSESAINLPLHSHFQPHKDLWSINKIKVIVNNIVFKCLGVNVFEELLLCSNFSDHLCSVPRLKNIECIWSIFEGFVGNRWSLVQLFTIIPQTFIETPPPHWIRKILIQRTIYFQSLIIVLFSIALLLKCCTFSFSQQFLCSLKGVSVKREPIGRKNILVSATGITFPSHSIYVSVSQMCQKCFLSFD